MLTLQINDSGLFVWIRLTAVSDLFHYKGHMFIEILSETDPCVNVFIPISNGIHLLNGLCSDDHMGLPHTYTG